MPTSSESIRFPGTGGDRRCWSAVPIDSFRPKMRKISFKRKRFYIQLKQEEVRLYYVVRLLGGGSSFGNQNEAKCT